MISKTSLQIIKALLELAALPIGETQGVGEIAKKIKAPENYLGKVLQRLVKEGVVISKKGLNGGFRLAKPPAETKLYDVVGVLEDLKRWDGCFMGNSRCSDLTACAAHQGWDKVRRTYINFLMNTSIIDLKNK